VEEEGGMLFFLSSSFPASTLHPENEMEVEEGGCARRGALLLIKNLIEIN